MDRYIQKLTKRPRLSEDPSVPVQSSSTTVATGSQSYIGDVDEPNHESEERVEPSHGIFLPHSNDPVMDDYEVDSRDISHDAIEDEVEPILPNVNFEQQSKALSGPSDISTNPSQAPVQPILQSYPKTMYGSRARSFVSTWYQGNTWMEYSQIKNQVFCFACRQFPSPRSTTGKDNEATYTAIGFSNWKKAQYTDGGFSSHILSTDQLKAMDSWTKYKEMQASDPLCRCRVMCTKNKLRRIDITLKQ